jgi:hypothetical protein
MRAGRSCDGPPRTRQTRIAAPPPPVAAAAAAADAAAIISSGMPGCISSKNDSGSIKQGKIQLLSPANLEQAEPNAERANHSRPYSKKCPHAAPGLRRWSLVFDVPLLASMLTHRLRGTPPCFEGRLRKKPLGFDALFFASRGLCKRKRISTLASAAHYERFLMRVLRFPNLTLRFKGRASPKPLRFVASSAPHALTSKQKRIAIDAATAVSAVGRCAAPERAM